MGSASAWGTILEGAERVLPPTLGYQDSTALALQQQLEQRERLLLAAGLVRPRDTGSDPRLHPLAETSGDNLYDAAALSSLLRSRASYPSVPQPDMLAGSSAQQYFQLLALNRLQQQRRQELSLALQHSLGVGGGIGLVMGMYSPQGVGQRSLAELPYPAKYRVYG